jgi:hypothetical protein
MNSCCSDDCPVKYGWCPPQINAEAKEYTNKLSDLTSIFNLALDRYKDTFPPRIVDPTEENISLYQQSKNKLDDIFGQLFSLESSIEVANQNINNKLQSDEASIGQLKDRYNVDHSKLEEIRNANLASYPLKREFQQFRMHSYVDLAYYVVGLCILIYILVKSVMAPPGGGIQFVTPQVALITAAAAAIVAAILAVYYG